MDVLQSRPRPYVTLRYGRRCSQGCNKCPLWYAEDDERRCVAAGKRAIEEFVTVHPHMANEARALTHVGPYRIR